MDTMIVVYIPCTGTIEAEKIGRAIMTNRLAPCYNIIADMRSAAFWPPKTGEVEEVHSGAVLLLKSVASKYLSIEREVKKLHSDTNPCIFAIEVPHVSKKYYAWLISEMEDV